MGKLYLERKDFKFVQEIALYFIKNTYIDKTIVQSHSTLRESPLVQAYNIATLCKHYLFYEIQC